MSRKSLETETEWLSCTDPGRMFRFMRPNASKRKLRLFACACIRRIWGLLADDKDAQVAVQLVERYAAGCASKEDFDALMGEMEARPESSGSRETRVPFRAIVSEVCAGQAAFATLRTSYCIRTSRRIEGRRVIETAVLTAAQAAVQAVQNAVEAQTCSDHRSRKREEAAEREKQAQCQLLRDLFGNPFCPVSVAPAWLHWNQGAIPRLAQSLYDDGAFERLPILADALEEAGCAETAILDHCRGAAVHARGCWLLDLVLAKS